MFPGRRSIKECQTHCLDYIPKKQETGKERTAILSALQPKQHIPEDVYVKIAAVHNSSVGHWGQAKCKRTLNEPSITDRMISTFIRQCPCCQVMSRFKDTPIDMCLVQSIRGDPPEPHRPSETRCSRQHVHLSVDRRVFSVGRAIPH